MRRVLAVLGAMAILAASQALASDEGAVRWGNWVSIGEAEFREFFPPVPVKGARWFSDLEGKCFLQAVVPMASLESVPSPDWFSSDGMGKAPSVGEEGMSWGRWILKDGKDFREFFPPVRSKGARFFSDPEGRCFSMPVVAEPELAPMDPPEWFSKDGMGVPPWRFEDTKG